MRQLTIDPEFRDKIPPLSADEFAKLEENILADGEVREPLVVWHNTIIDGHHRWAIIQKHPEIPYKIKQMEFPDKWAATVWMCQNQLGRRNLTDAQKAYLIGKQYEAQKLSVGGTRGNENAKKRMEGTLPIVSKNKNGVAGIIGEKNGISHWTVKESEHFSKGVDAAELVSPGIKDKILSGTIKAPKSKIAEIAKMDEPKKKQAVEALESGDSKKISSVFTPEIRVTQKPIIEPEYKVIGSSEYNTDDFKEELMAVVKTFAFNFKMTLTVHSEMLAEEDGKEKAIAALSEAEKTINKLKELLK